MGNKAHKGSSESSPNLDELAQETTSKTGANSGSNSK